MKEFLSSALLEAARNGHLRIVERLLREDVDLKEGYGLGESGTTLQWAACDDHAEIVEDICTALALAAGNGNMHMVNALFDAGSEINNETSTRFLALSYNHVAVVVADRLFGSVRLKGYETTKEGPHPLTKLLHRAAIHGHEKIVRSFFENWCRTSLTL
jgi:hypothetical protein